MANYALHKLIVIHINMLVIVHIKVGQSGKILVVRLLSLSSPLQTFQKHFLNKFIMPTTNNIKKVFLLCTSVYNIVVIITIYWLAPKSIKQVISAFNLCYTLTLTFEVEDSKRTARRNCET